MGKLINLKGKRMINLTYQQIREKSFNETLVRVMNAKMPIPVSRRLIAITDEVKKEQGQSDKLFEALTAQYLEPMPESRGQLLRTKETLSEDEKKEAEQKLKEFLETKVEIQKEPIKDLEIQFLNLSATELMAIEGIIVAD